MQKTNVAAMVEAGVMSGMAVVGGLISAYIPILGGIVGMIWPVPIILLGVRHGYKWSIMATVVAGILIAILTDPIRAAKVVTLCPIGIVLGHAFRSGYRPGKAMLWGSVAAVISLGVFSIMTFFLLGINPFAIDVNVLGAGMDQAMAFYRSHGVGEQQLAQTKEIMLNFVKLMQVLLPMSFASSAVVMTAMNFTVSRLVLKRLGHQIPAFPPFKHWTVPPFALYAFIAGTAGSYFGQSREIELLYTVGENLRYFGIILTFVQGLAVFYFLADKYNLSRLVRGIILLLIFSNSLFAFTLVYAGAFDIALDYRKLRTPRRS